jgi:hypothetical protein
MESRVRTLAAVFGTFFDLVDTAINESNKYIGTDTIRKRFPNSGNNLENNKNK